MTVGETQQWLRKLGLLESAGSRTIHVKNLVQRAIQSQADAVLPILRAVCDGYSYDPGDSDLDNEQPITVRMTLGDYRRASRLKWELERQE